MKKNATKSMQYLPKLLINNHIIPTVKAGKSFKYLGRYFDFHMSNQEQELELISLINERMSAIDSKPLHPRHKLLL